MDSHFITASSPPAVTASSPPAVTASSPSAVPASSPSAVPASSPPAVPASSPSAVTASSPSAVTASSPSAVTASSPPIVTPNPSHTTDSPKVGPTQRKTPPNWLMVAIGKENGYDLKLNVAKKLKINDVRKRQTCLLIPSKNILDSSFLTETEREMLDVQSLSNNVKGEEGLKVTIFDHRSKKSEVILKKRKTKGIWGFVLIKGWFPIADGNDLKAGKEIELWSFRSREGSLCFGLVSDICTDQDTIDAPLPDVGSFEDTDTVVSYF